MPLDEIKPAATLDTRGLSCPMPLLKAKQVMEQLSPGEVLEIIGTDPGSRVDLPAWSKYAGHTFLKSTEQGGAFKFYIKKG